VSVNVTTSSCSVRYTYLCIRVQISWIGWDRQLHWPGFHGDHPSRYPTQSVERPFSTDVYQIPRLCLQGKQIPYIGRVSWWFSVPFRDLPGSAYHHTLSPWLHDLHEGALVKKATLPGTLWSCNYRDESVQQGNNNKRVKKERVDDCKLEMQLNQSFFP